MERYRASLAAALCATTFLTAGVAWAANTAPMKEANAVPQATADKDLGKLSADGSAAFSDILLARRAIFDGRTDDAKKYVGLAEAGFNKAKTDDTVFMKAEAALKPPEGNAQAEKPATAYTTPPPDEGAPVAWVPVDESIDIVEDIKGNSNKTAAVGDADKSLQKGDKETALKKLKAAGIEVAVVVAVMPVEKTIEDVHQAAVMIDAGKYYEGSQELRLAEAGERFDAVGNMGTPKE